MADLLRRDDGGVAWLTLNRPDSGNALTPPMRDELCEWLEEISRDTRVRTVVLTGAGHKGFCTGADMRSRNPSLRPDAGPERPVGTAARSIRTGWQRLIAAILDCEKPVVAGINGTAAGGGAHLALACDLAIMASEARLIEVFVRRGIMPDAGGCYLLPRLIGPQRAKELMFFGDDVSAAAAERLGLVNRVVPRTELHDACAEWSTRLASAPTRALAMAKALVNRSTESDRPTAFAEEAWAQELVSGTEDAEEGMRSFVERRSPQFKGW